MLAAVSEFLASTQYSWWVNFMRLLWFLIIQFVMCSQPRLKCSVVKKAS